MRPFNEEMQVDLTDLDDQVEFTDDLTDIGHINDLDSARTVVDKPPSASMANTFETILKKFMTPFQKDMASMRDEISRIKRDQSRKDSAKSVANHVSARYNSKNRDRSKNPQDDKNFPPLSKGTYRDKLLTKDLNRNPNRAQATPPPRESGPITV